MSQNLINIDNILFGSDFPLRQEAGVTRSIEEINYYDNYSASQRSEIYSGNAKDFSDVSVNDY